MKWKFERLFGVVVVTVALFPLQHSAPIYIPGLFLFIRDQDLVNWVQLHMEDASFAHWWAAISLFLIAVYLGMRARDIGTNDEKSRFRIVRLIYEWRWKALFCAVLTNSSGRDSPGRSPSKAT